MTIYRVYDTTTEPSTLVLSTNATEIVAQAMGLDNGDVLWSIEECYECTTDTHRLEVVDPDEFDWSHADAVMMGAI